MNKNKVLLIILALAAFALVVQSCGKSGGFGTGGNVTFNGAGS